MSYYIEFPQGFEGADNCYLKGDVAAFKKLPLDIRQAIEEGKVINISKEEYDCTTLFQKLAKEVEEQPFYDSYDNLAKSFSKTPGQFKNMITCPFHEDKNPSLAIYSNKTFYCFGCNSTGSTNILGIPKNNLTYKKIINKRGEGKYWYEKNTINGTFYYESNSEEQDDIIDKFIFRQEDLHRKEIFPFLKIKTDVAGYGIFLPRNIQKQDKTGSVTHTEQIRTPVIIGSDHKLYEINRTFTEKHKIRFGELPDSEEYPLRWELENIKEWLDNKTPIINGEELYNQIMNFYKKYLYFSNDNWYKIHAIWDIGTYFFLLAKYYPIMELRGLKRTAKTKIMTLSRMFTFNSTEEMSNPTESTLFRETHSKRPTKYIDEAEKLFIKIKGRLEPDMRAELLNSGYKYTGSVPRQEKIGTKFRTINYNTYSPSMIGSINGLQGATEDRAIVHITVKNPPTDKRGNLEPNPENKEYQAIRNKLYCFALQNWQEIQNSYQESDIKTKLSDRDLKIWELILVIAKRIDLQLYMEIKEFAEQLTQIKSIDNISEGSIEDRILTAVKTILDTSQEELTRVMLRGIREYFEGEHKPSQKTISSHMDRMGFMEFKKHWREGNGYLLTKELFYNLYDNIMNIASQSSHSSHNRENNEKTV